MPSLPGAGHAPGFTDVVLLLHSTRSTGRLRVERDGVTRDFWIRRGVLIAAESSSGVDSLEHLLLTAEAITPEGLGKVRAGMAAGLRRGPALIEAARLTPAQLVDWTERRVRFLAKDSLCWHDPVTTFEEGSGPSPEAIIVSLQLPEILMETLRDGPAEYLFAALRPAGSIIPVPAVPASPVSLRPEETYVLRLVDGNRSVDDIAGVSEFGVAATVGVLTRLAITGWLHGAPGQAETGLSAVEGIGPGPEDLASRAGLSPEPPSGDATRGRPSGESPGLQDWLAFPPGDSYNTLRACIRTANELFVGAGAYVGREIGPISEQLLEKALRDARSQHPALFQRVVASRDGSLPEETLMRNLGLIREQDPRRILFAGLDGYLGGILQVVRRFLGPQHEHGLKERVRELKCPGA